MKFILNISIYLYFLKVIKTLHPMISMWSVFYTYNSLHNVVGSGEGGGGGSNTHGAQPIYDYKP